MTHAHTYAPPALETHRLHLRVLFKAFADATGWPPTFVGFVARGEPKWARQFEERDFTHSSYDTAISRLSALWPEDVPWPAEVPRQAPATEIPEEILARVEQRKAKDAKARPALPGGAPWPDDIPQPGEGGQNGESTQA
jgi:hypothetical protein